MKLPKIKIDYSKYGEYPLNGDRVLLHCNEFVDKYHDDPVGVVEGYFCLDDYDSCWVVCANNSVGVWPTHYTPMPKFEEVQESNQQVKKDLVVTGETMWFKKWPVKGGA